jgi:hypothetical protein
MHALFAALVEWNVRGKPKRQQDTWGTPLSLLNSSGSPHSCCVICLQAGLPRVG